MGGMFSSQKSAEYYSCPCGGHVRNRELNVKQHNKTLMHLRWVGKVDEYKPQYPAIKERKERKERERWW